MSDDPLLTWKGRRVRSPGDGPEAAARKVPEAPRPGSLFFVPSPLEGWGLDVLLDRLPDEGAVVVFEKDPELTLRCEARWHQTLGERIGDRRLFRLASDTEQAVQDLFRKLPLGRLRRCEFLTLNGAWLCHGPRYREVFQRLDQGLTRWWSNRITCLHMGPLWIRNLIDNLSAPGFHPSPWSDWGSAPVLVCGAGVTLESCLPWARNQKGLRIVAADTALPILKEEGLKPDAVVCLEAQHANLRDFAGWLGADIELYTDLTSYPPGTRVFRQPPRWFITEFAPLSLWDRWPWGAEVPRLPPLGSVGVAAAWVAWRLSRGPVVLAGLDFSFPVGKTHARGAPALTALAARTHRFQPLEQTGVWVKSGMRVTPSGWLTTPVMEGYAGVLADQARPHSGRTRVWSPQGLDLGLEVLGSAEREKGMPAVSAKAPAAGAASPRSGDQAARWLSEEAQRWTDLLSLVDEALTSPSEPVWKALEDGLGAVDYLTFTFPDPEFRRAPDWLVRVRHQLRWALGRIER